MRFCVTAHCGDCVDRSIADEDEKIITALSNPNGNPAVKRRLIERLVERRGLKDEGKRIGLI